MTRGAALQAVIDSLQVAFRGADLSPQAAAALTEVFARLETPCAGRSAAGQVLPVTGLFDQAIGALLNRTDALAPLARALQDLAPDLVWTTRAAVGPTASPGFATAHANALLVGPAGLEPRADVWLGLSLMAPFTRYPDHDHAPEEVYLALSPGDFQHGDAPWVARAPGQTFHNTPGIRHAMRATDQPFLALWCLPV